MSNAAKQFLLLVIDDSHLSVALE